MAKVKDMANGTAKEVSLEKIVTNAIKIPGVKVSRNEFLAKTFEKKAIDIHKILDDGPIEAGCSEELLAKLANKLIFVRTSESSAASFAAGIPGGLAMAATIPADTLQYFGMTLRLAQELTYLYGADDLWENGEINSIMVRDQLILYCGVMFGVAGASASVRLLSSQLAKQTLKKLPQKALTKTVWYPIVKQIGKIIGVKITKSTAAKGIAKAIPIIGGIVSGGMTFASMKPMGQRLADTLDEAKFHYSEAEVMSDYEKVQVMARDFADEEHIMDAEVIEFEEFEEPLDSKVESDDVFAKLEKLAKLKNIGAITEDDFNLKKEELLAMI